MLKMLTYSGRSSRLAEGGTLVYWTKAIEKDQMGDLLQINSTTSFGVHSRILQSRSKVTRVIFLLFLRLSSVLLSIPALSRAY